MTDQRIIQAEYVDLKRLKTRAVYQIVCEVDESMARAVIDRLGLPMNGKQMQVAIARLKEDES